MENSIQDITEPYGICYGCGPVNPEGLRLKSYMDESNRVLKAQVTPDPKYTGWPDLVYGGYLAMLVDCHSNWAAMAAHYRAENRAPGSEPKISCVTGHLGLSFLKPTPLGVELDLAAWVEGDIGRKVRVLCEIRAGNILTVKGDSTFVRIDTRALAEKARSQP